MQSRGTAAVGRLFGPVMLVWFATIAACGVRGIADHPAILKALSPTYALDFFFSHFSVAFFALAAVVLAVTGAEALYADLGHFGRAPITRAWLALVFPACTLSYLGQGGLILDDPRNISSPFFLLVPSWGQAWLPLLIATAVFTVFTTWHRGRRIVTARREEQEGPLRAFIDQLHTRRPPVLRAPGTAVFLNRGTETAPLAMRASVEHLRSLNEHVVILTIETRPVPHVPPADRLVLDDLGYRDDGIAHATARFGYMQRPDVPSGPAPDREVRARVPDPRGGCLVLPVDHRARPRRRSGPRPMAEDAVPRHLAHHRRRRRVLRAPSRADGDHRLADRGVAARPQARPR